jgi:hypothetical protein
MKRRGFRQFRETVREFESRKPSGVSVQYQVPDPLSVPGKYPMNSGLLFEIGYISHLRVNPAQRSEDVQWSDFAILSPKSLSMDSTPASLASAIFAVPGSAIIEGTNQNDTLMGSDRDDEIVGLDGDDFIQAGAGNDIVQGGRGKDRLHGDAGNDQLKGGGGADLFQGGTGNDQLDGGGGGDQLIGVDPKAMAPGQNERDVFIGGTGQDVFVLGNTSKVFYNDTKGTTLSNQGYAQIQDFNITEGDVIQLHGKATDYRVGTLSGQ